MTSSGADDDNSLEIQAIQKKIDAQVLLSHLLKKRNSLGLFYKRILTITNEPKLFYCREPKDKAQVHKLKQIVLNPDTIRLERLDKTKFKIQDCSKNKRSNFVFRCYDDRQCEQWVLIISQEIEKLRGMSPDLRLQHFKQGSQSQVNLPTLALKKQASQDSRGGTPSQHSSQTSLGSKSYLTKSATKTPSHFANL